MRLPGRGRSGAEKPRIPRKDRRGMSPFVAGLIALALICVGTWFGFTKDNPFSSGFQMTAVFESANSIRPASPVRIAGVDVGKVVSVDAEEGSTTSRVTLEIADEGLPIHKDATMKIRPRIFLEGNFFVDLQPGTPSAPTIEDGDTIPVTQTAIPVQIDEVLTTLQDDTREDLKALLEGYGTTLTHEPTAAEDRDQDPIARGKTAAEALNLAYRDGGPALRDTSIVNEAFLGTRPGDVSRLLAGLRRTTRGLGRNTNVLQDLVSNFNTTLGAFATEQDALRGTLRELPPTLRTADTALASLNAAFPATRRFAREILPGVRETPATIEASFPWIDQMRRLLRPTELRGLLAELTPATRSSAIAIDATVRLLPEADRLSQCFSRVLLPTGDIVIEDGFMSTGVENYKEFWYTMVGLAGEGQNFDGNGQYVRFQTGGGSNSVSTGQIPGAAAGNDRLFGNAAAQPLGTRPAYPGKRPPYRPDAPCKDQKLPDLNAARVGPPDASQPRPDSLAIANVAKEAEARPRSGADDVARRLADAANPIRKPEQEAGGR
jgi:phospholipid/cholesterol/gamma-HCH transport system substrate-binding protein